MSVSRFFGLMLPHAFSHPGALLVVSRSVLPYLAMTMNLSFFACAQGPDVARKMSGGGTDRLEFASVPADSDAPRGVAGEEGPGYWVDRVEEDSVVLEIDRAGDVSVFVLPLGALPFTVGEGDRAFLTLFPGPATPAFPTDAPHTYGEIIRQEDPWVYCRFSNGLGFMPGELFPKEAKERSVFAIFGHAEHQAPRLAALMRLRASLNAQAPPAGQQIPTISRQDEG